MESALQTSGVSVVVVAFNESSLLRSTLPSVIAAAGRLSGPFEIVVVDDGSSDGTGDVAEALGVRVLHQPTKRGAGAARNAGAADSTGRWLVFLDADVVVSEYALQAMFEAVDREQLSLAGFRAIYRPDKLSSWILCAWWDYLRSRGGPCQGVGQTVDRAVFDGVGGYREDWLMGEDTEFYVRAQHWAAQHGEKCAIVEDAVIWPSTRRFDAWSAARMWALQNPLVARLRPNSKALWGSWRNGDIR